MMARETSRAKPSTDFSRSAVSRYIQLATLFRRRIETSEWRVGGRIPTVDELADECGVARATIRQACGLLEAEGLIKRFRAKGTFVLKRPQEGLWCEVNTDWSGLLRSREDAVIEILSSEIVDTPQFVPHAIGELASSYRHLRRRHWRNEQSFLFADVYIDQSLCKKIPASEYKTKSSLRLVAGISGVHIVDFRQSLTVGAADIETAEKLHLPLNAPVAHVNRSAVDNRGRLVLISNGIYRGDVVRLDMKLK
jgi:GntR family transcriptional regulator